MNDKVFAVYETRRFLFWKRSRIISIAGSREGALAMVDTVLPGSEYTVREVSRATATAHIHNMIG